MPESASVQGDHYDSMLLVTLYLTGFVFFVTQILLFYFVYRYQSAENRKAFFYSQQQQVRGIVDNRSGAGPGGTGSDRAENLVRNYR